jgi:predicted HAD superfamily Cof-like phosphohydrolase
MKSLLDDVRAFHEAFGVDIRAAPGFPAPERVLLRKKLVYEEIAEFSAACASGDLPGVADALADAIYVLVGTALEFGIPLDRVWDEVQRSNMAKADPLTGKAIKREDGKVLKPSGWTPPDIAGCLE